MVFQNLCWYSKLLMPSKAIILALQHLQKIPVWSMVFSFIFIFFNPKNFQTNTALLFSTILFLYVQTCSGTSASELLLFLFVFTLPSHSHSCSIRMFLELGKFRPILEFQLRILPSSRVIQTQPSRRVTSYMMPGSTLGMLHSHRH